MGIVKDKGSVLYMKNPALVAYIAEFGDDDKYCVLLTQTCERDSVKYVIWCSISILVLIQKV